MRKLLAIIEAPGKAASLRQTLRGLGIDAEVVATAGHFASWPNSLWPLGARVVERSGAPFVDEFARTISGERATAVQNAIVKAIRRNARIVVATDPDPEGEAIALDVALLAASATRLPPGRLERMRLHGLDETCVSLALASVVQMSWSSAAKDAAPARARALLDRIAGSAFSKPGAPAGRVFTAGLALLKNGAKNAPAGEIRLSAHAADGGSQFLSRVEIFPNANGLAESEEGIASKTIDLIVKYVGLQPIYASGRMPGRVKKIAPLSAGVAIRVAGTPCYDACSLVVDAGRAGLPARQTAAAAQSLYMKGLISYPRTAATDLPESGVAGLLRLASAIGVNAFDPSSPFFIEETMDPEIKKLDDPGACHHGLHPLFTMARNRHETAALVDVVMSPTRDSSVIPDEDERFIYALVARRALQAGLPSRLERGVWTRDNADAPDEIVEALEDVDWFRETAPRPPWECMPSFGLQSWPLEARVADALTRARLVRPSTVASHAARIANYACLVEPEAPLSAIRLNAIGADMLDAAPAALKSGDFARAIDALAKDAADWPGLTGGITAKGNNGDATKDAIGQMLAWALKRGSDEFQRQGGAPDAFLAPLSQRPGSLNPTPRILAGVADGWDLANSVYPQAGETNAEVITEAERVEDVRFAEAAGRTSLDDDEQKPIRNESVPDVEKIIAETIDEEEPEIDYGKRPTIS